jgi:hypothetical protein
MQFLVWGFKAVLLINMSRCPEMAAENWQISLRKFRFTDLRVSYESERLENSLVYEHAADSGG